MNNLEYKFGGNRERTIQRDGEQCVECGITREQHKIKYGRDISVDHIDGLGTNMPTHLRNNSLDNLQTLCIICHGSKDGKRTTGGTGVIHRKRNPLHPTQQAMLEIAKTKDIVNMRPKDLAEMLGINHLYLVKVHRDRLIKYGLIGKPSDYNKRWNRREFSSIRKKELSEFGVKILKEEKSK